MHEKYLDKVHLLDYSTISSYLPVDVQHKYQQFIYRCQQVAFYLGLIHNN